MARRVTALIAMVALVGLLVVLVWRVYLFQNCMRLQQVCLGRNVVSLLLEQLA